MAKTKSFKELVQKHVKDDAKFAEALLREGVDAMLGGDGLGDGDGNVGVGGAGSANLGATDVGLGADVGVGVHTTAGGTLGFTGKLWNTTSAGRSIGSGRKVSIRGADL